MLYAPELFTTPSNYRQLIVTVLLHFELKACFRCTSGCFIFTKRVIVLAIFLVDNPGLISLLLSLQSSFFFGCIRFLIFVGCRKSQIDWLYKGYNWANAEFEIKEHSRFNVGMVTLIVWSFWKWRKLHKFSTYKNSLDWPWFPRHFGCTCGIRYFFFKWKGIYLCKYKHVVHFQSTRKFFMSHLYLL